MFHRVASTADLGDGDVLAIEVEGVEMVLYRSGEDIFAAQRRCLHQGADLADGIVSGGYLICAQHGWRFEAASGAHEMSPKNCLVTYRTEVDGGEIRVDPTPIDAAGPA